MKKIKIIITRYKEGLGWTKYLHFPYIVYNKSDLPAENSISVPNISKEDYGYIKFIIDNYEDLPDYMVFLQGHPFDHESRLFGILASDMFFCQNGFFQLGDWGEKMEPVYPPEHFLHKLLILPEKVENYYFISSAQFIVSKGIVLYRSKSFYEKIMKMIETEEIDGFDLEYVWWVLFDSNYQEK